MHEAHLYALPPRRSGRRKAKAAAMPTAPVIVDARDPRRIRRSPVTATRIVAHGKVPELTEYEMRRRSEAANRLWQEIKRAVGGAAVARQRKAPPSIPGCRASLRSHSWRYCGARLARNSDLMPADRSLPDFPGAANQYGFPTTFSDEKQKGRPSRAAPGDGQ